MNPFTLWIAENFVLFLSLAFLVSAALLVGGAVGAWRTGRQLRTPPRPVVRFLFELAAVGAGIAGVAIFSDGLRTAVPVDREQGRMIGEPAPGFAFTWVEDQSPGQLAEFQGQVVLLNLWATWCPPCREEAPALDELQKNYQEAGLVVLLISDETRQRVSDYLAEYPSTVGHGVAQPMPWPEFGRPTSYVVDREGVVRRVITGPRDYAGFEREVRDYL